MSGELRRRVIMLERTDLRDAGLADIWTELRVPVIFSTTTSYQRSKMLRAVKRSAKSNL